MRAWSVVSLVLLIAGCGEDERRCEHAREVVLARWEQLAQEAIAGVEDPTSGPGLAAQARAEVERARSSFVGECLALPPAGRDCVARIDEILAADARQRAARERCMTGEHGWDAACLDAAQTEVDPQILGCQKLLGPAFVWPIRGR